MKGRLDPMSKTWGFLQEASKLVSLLHIGYPLIRVDLIHQHASHIFRRRVGDYEDVKLIRP